MSYVLHYAPDNASLIIRLALDHIGVPYRAALVDRTRQAQRGQEYRRLNPAGQIPVLETPQGPLFETGAILLWLGDTHGGLGPKPDDPARADYLKWLFFTANTLHPALRMLLYPALYISDGHHAALRAGLEQSIAHALALLDEMAATDPRWFFGSGLDFYIAACLRWCALYPTGYDTGWFDLARWPHLREICVRVEAMPATCAAQYAEGLGDTPFTAPSYPNPPEGSAT